MGHVGDSRAYLYRDGSLKQVTEDHSLVGELVRSGVLSPEDALSYPYRNIDRAVGTDQSLDSDITRVAKQPGDKWLLCSDGLADYADTEDILQAMQLPSGGGRPAAGLCADRGRRDNITLLFLEVPQWLAASSWTAIAWRS